MEFVFDWVENIVGKEENAGFQHFLLFPQCFQMASPQGHSKSGLYGEGLTTVPTQAYKFCQFLDSNSKLTVEWLLCKVDVSDLYQFVRQRNPF